MAQPCERILVIKLSALGDVVLALAAMRQIRKAHPNAHITVLTTPAYAPLIRLSPYADDVDPGGRPSGFRAWVALVIRLRRGRFTRVYDLQTSSRSSLLHWALLPFAPPWSGIAPLGSLRHRNPERDDMHTLERQADQLREAGIWPDAPIGRGQAPGPDVSWIVEAGPDLQGMSDGPAPDVLLVPGGSAHRPRKRWPARAYGELAARLGGLGLRVAVIGADQERPLAAEILSVAPDAMDLTGKTDLVAIARLAARARLVVGNDTGPLHLAAAAGPPTLVFFSDDSDPDLSAPRGCVEVLHAPDLADMPVDRAYEAAVRMMAARALA